MYVSKDRHTAVAEIFPRGTRASRPRDEKPTRAALRRAAPAGTTVHLTGHDPLYAAASGGDTNGPSILLEAMIGGLGALVILLFVFGTLPAIAMPLLVAIASILNTFTLVWLLTYITDVSIIVQFLIALVGLGIAIDYALLVIFRFREELRHGSDIEDVARHDDAHAGRSVIVSGSTVAVGLLSMIVLPLPFIRSIGIGGMLIPAVSVLAAITLLPAMLASLGPRINSVRVMPKRIVEGSDAETGFWSRWAGFVVRRPVPVAITGLAIVGVLLFYGLQLNPSEAQAKDLPGRGRRHRRARRAGRGGITAGVYKPFEILVEGAGARSRRTPRRAARSSDGPESSARASAPQTAHERRGARRGDPGARRRREGRAPGDRRSPARRAAGRWPRRPARGSPSAAPRRRSATSCTRSTATSRGCCCS